MGIYNDPRWHKLRAQVRKRKVCANCGCAAVGKYNAHVDHKISWKARPDLAFDIRNLQLLCSHCHNSVKRRFENREAIGVGADGLPTSKDHAWNK